MNLCPTQLPGLTNTTDATSGSVLFGGIDKSKFTSPLVTLNLLPYPSQAADEVLAFVTTVTALSATVSSQETKVFSGGTDSTAAYSGNDVALAVLLDTGSSAWSLPQNYYEAILPLFPYVDPRDRTCDCKYRNNNDSIAVTFGDKITINVPVRQFIVPVYDPLTNEPQYLDTDNEIQACVFMLVPASGALASSPFLTLGDAVLRSMYVVYDLDNGQVSLAQASLDTTSTPDILRVSSGPDGVASAMGSSSVSTAASNSASIAPAVSAGETFSASAVGSTVGVATGTDAVPGDARASQTGEAGASSSTAAAAGRSGVVGGGFDGGVVVSFLVVMGGMILGGGLLVG